MLYKLRVAVRPTITPSTFVVKPNTAISTRRQVQSSLEAQSKEADTHFLRNHLRAPPSTKLWLTKSEDIPLVEEIQGVGTFEAAIYPPICKLLTSISQRLHKTLPLHLRYLSSPIIFLDHHNNHLTHFPLEEVRDKPDIVGVVGSAHDFVRANGHSDYKSIPYHRVETFVEAKATRKDGRAQAASYAWQHLQARPDHPGVYCLSVKPETYQVLWSDPSGVVASPHTSWKGLQLLAAFLYSLYMPPLSHFVRDPSIVWTEPPGQVFGPPRWTITSQGVKYRDCSILFNGKAWGNRTTVFSSPATESSGFAIIKESYTDNASRFQEADILQHIHSDGLMPGVVRLVDSENVQVDEQAIGTSARCDATRRTKARLIMGSRGTRLENARSIADLLKAIYDALEVHRNVAIGRKVLHGDMRVDNILMYPEHRVMSNRSITTSPPTLIDDILNRTSGEGVDHSRCILIDWDNAMMLDEDQYLGCKDLAHRIVTRAAPAKMLGSRSNARTFKGMPELTGEALTRYVEAHGYTRYEAYNGLSSRVNFHGGQVSHHTFTERMDIRFLHHLEHDVESVYWTMFSVILRVHPYGDPVESVHSKVLSDAWNRLHTPTMVTNCRSDIRDMVLAYDADDYRAILPQKLHSVALLLASISEQIRAKRAVLEHGPPKEDHLHEAVQRIILQYLVDYVHDPIPLEPNFVRRPVTDIHAQALISTSEDRCRRRPRFCSSL